MSVFSSPLLTNPQIRLGLSVLFTFLIVLISSFNPVDKPLYHRETKDRPLTIMLISDLNATYGSVSYSTDVSATLNEIDRIKPDIILCAGDMVAGQKASLTTADIRAMWQGFNTSVFTRIRDKKVPFGFTVGNHDASPSFSKDREIAADFWKTNQHDTRLSFVDATNYPFYFSYIKNNVFFISWDASGAKIKPEVYEWMKKQMAGSAARKARMRILLGHLPLYAIVAAKNKAGEVNAEPDSALAFFKTHQIDMYISGHQHAYYPAEKNGIHLLHAGCIGDGPRQILGLDEVPKKAYTVIEIPVKRPLQFHHRSFIPHSNEEIKQGMLPDSVSGFNGTVYRSDIKKYPKN